jgi:hypothetical protein
VPLFSWLPCTSYCFHLAQYFSHSSRPWKRPFGAPLFPYSFPNFPVPPYLFNDGRYVSHSTCPLEGHCFLTVSTTSLYLPTGFMGTIMSPNEHGLEYGPLEGRCFLTFSMTSMYLLIYSRPSFLSFIQILEYGLQRASCSYFFVHGPGLGPSRRAYPYHLSILNFLFPALKMEAARFSVQLVVYTILHVTTFHKTVIFMI